MRPSRSAWLLGSVLWLLLLAGGWHTLLRHQLTPGPGGQVPQTWPAESVLRPDCRRPTLVLFAHRNCPCTRTTLGELLQILTRCSGRAAVRIVLLAPPSAMTDRVGHDLEALARSLPEAEVVVDAEGGEARRFGVRTSGHVVLYGADGRLLFSGGITASRGHAGDSDGQTAVTAWLQVGKAEQKSAPVYGCSLFINDDEAEQENE